ncbi:hypothetical protein Tco_0175871, partial [Tanacetum coccineum]
DSVLESDEELARKVQEEWEAEEEKNKIAEEQATNEALIKDFDDIKARIEAYRILAEKLQEQEREQFTIEERAKFLHDIQLLLKERNYKHAELKIKKFEEVQALYEKIKRPDEDFISIGSAEDERLIKKMNKKGVCRNPIHTSLHIITPRIGTRNKKRDKGLERREELREKKDLDLEKRYYEN